MSIIQFSINSKQKKFTLNFDNNLQLNFDFEYLRVFSPAAVKPKKSNAAPDVFHKKNIQLLHIEPLGKYGHRLVFDDKHSAIFTDEIFIHLYENHEINWQQYCASLTSSQNRESSINFVKVK
ncbi:MAG: gamma-butyrobetaine hydroxylase-like domain-containing protein [Alteromonadaceae bacterium]